MMLEVPSLIGGSLVAPVQIASSQETKILVKFQKNNLETLKRTLTVNKWKRHDN